jgi:hypothetical protein
MKVTTTVVKDYITVKLEPENPLEECVLESMESVMRKGATPSCTITSKSTSTNAELELTLNV